MTLKQKLNAYLNSELIFLVVLIIIGGRHKYRLTKPSTLSLDYPRLNKLDYLLS